MDSEQMSVYVDDMRMEAQVGSINARWSHMMADTHDELVAMARKLRLRDEWIQYPGEWKEHYDVTDAKRYQAIKLGAIAIETGGEQWSALVERKRADHEEVT
jgi:hypothetical protein